MTPDAAARPVARIAGLDGLRAIAVLLVIGSHTRILDPSWNAGTVGVTIFFTLSGYLITGILVREYEATGRIDVLRFAKRRAIRIFPAYYLALAVLLVIAPMDRDAMTAAATYTINFSAPLRLAPWLSHFWSLAVEEHFYLAWPLAVWFLRGRVAWFALALAACASIVALIGFDARWTLPAVLPIALGAVLATLRFVPRLPGVLSWKPLVYIGQISYGLYIWQGIWTANGSNPIGGFPPVSTPASLVLTFLCAAASWQFLERPLLRWRDSGSVTLHADRVAGVGGPRPASPHELQAGWRVEDGLDAKAVGG